nr:hypothetical protein DBT53_09840 [Aerococcus mictus]
MTAGHGVGEVSPPPTESATYRFLKNIIYDYIHSKKEKIIYFLYFIFNFYFALKLSQHRLEPCPR